VILAFLALLLATPALAADVTVTGLTEGQAVSGPLRVSATPVGVAAQSLTFTLMNAAGATVANTMEWQAPYCFLGDFGALPCTAFDTTTVPNGAYTMRTVMVYSSGALTKTIAFTIANGVTPPPVVGSLKTATVKYTEPSTNWDGTPLLDLARTTIWCTIAGQPEQKCSDVAASAVKGGAPITYQQAFTNMPTGTRVSFRVTADDIAGNRSDFTPPQVWTAPATIPGQAGVSVTVITE
jgi:hypothetical protein